MLFTIHQPNFLPWLGYFDKVNKADVFIFYDHVQRTRGKSWTSRVKANCNGSEKWLTLPIDKSGNRIQRICESEIKESRSNFELILGKLNNYYQNATYLKETIGFLEDLNPKSELIADFNILFTKQLSKKLGIKTIFYKSSDQEQLMGSPALRNEMIIETCKVFNIASYLSGDGAGDFLDKKMFIENGIDIQFQNFKHPSYSQLNSEKFIPGLSIIDALMNIGFSGTAKLLNDI